MIIEINDRENANQITVSGMDKNEIDNNIKTILSAHGHDPTANYQIQE